MEDRPVLARGTVVVNAAATPRHLLVDQHKDRLLSAPSPLKGLEPVKPADQGRDRVTPLHLAVEIEETELLPEFLCLCPSVIMDLTSRCETAVHVAVKNCRFDAFRVLLR
ncbi:hypothetical protein MLD38_038933 [Melastoma candidum]|uniref:Uncharacterized protein n=1 Tax=Melastoma candidum TaxID=119954 RepID=A0ACB9L1S3_9MYRT|nr:hypothetical protein MLD38_038933 [Melastoma candidum]